MNKYPTSKETVELALPLNGAYVSAARLTVASIANRLGFDVDEIEDLKAAVSEACIYIIKKCPPNSLDTFNISFIMLDNSLEIHLNANVGINSDSTTEEMGLVMIKALMDGLTIDIDNHTKIVMHKNHNQNSF